MLDKLLICPKCKNSIGIDLFCNSCNYQYPQVEDVHVLFKEDAFSDSNNPDNNHEFRNKEYNVRFYSTVGKYLFEVEQQIGNAEVLSYLNFGYLSNKSEQYSKIELEDHLMNRNSVKLALEVIGHVSLDDKVILEVGCGRGGNILTMLNYYNPERIVGLDICAYSILFCKRVHKFKNLDFIIGDAENLPVTDKSFDVVFNLESSHAYPNIRLFYSEVYRVLQPDGIFLYSDIFSCEEFEKNTKILEEIGFDIVRNTDITTNVILSCNENSKVRAEALKYISEEHEDNLKEFVGLSDSDVYRNMASGDYKYKILTLKRRNK